MVKKSLILILFFVAATVEISFLQVALLRLHDPQTTSWIKMRLRQAYREDKELSIKHTWISRETIPKIIRMAVIAAEDDKFYEHNGFDWEALRKAYEGNEQKGKIRRGGSTITQQLAKNLFLTGHRSYIRKGREAFYTVLLEFLLTKDRILDIYLNSIEFGPGIFGIEEAAKYHFHVSARQLSLDQSCRLASIIPSPLRYKINGNYVSERASVLKQIIGGSND